MNNARINKNVHNNQYIAGCIQNADVHTLNSCAANPKCVALNAIPRIRAAMVTLIMVTFVLNSTNIISFWSPRTLNPTVLAMTFINNISYAMGVPWNIPSQKPFNINATPHAITSVACPHEIKSKL